MGLDTTKVLYGAGVFSIGDYVTAGGAGTLADVGHIKAPYELSGSMENFDIETERATGLIATSPIKDDHQLSVTFHQNEAEWMRIAYGQPSANKSGSGANLTLRIGDRVAQYHQATLVVPGPGSLATRTLTFWRLQIIGREPINYGKAVEQLLKVTFRILRDDSVATADKYFKQVDT